MKQKNKSLYLFSAAIALVLVFAVISLEAYGRNSRRSGEGRLINDPRMRRVSISYPGEAYFHWAREKFRGRIVIAVGRRMNFMYKESASPNMSFPLKASLLAPEKDLKNENFLAVSMDAGIAREVINVTSEGGFKEKLAFAVTEEGATVRENRIEVPYFGSPRVIAALPFFRAPEESVLLYINASIFREYEPEKLLKLLLKAGTKTDLVVLCSSLDDQEVSDADRRKLQRFKSLLEGGHGQD